MIDPVLLADALLAVREAVGDACVRSGRDRGACDLVLAGKYVSPEDAPALVTACAVLIGENRLQDLVAKQDVLGDAATFDFIGHLQSRKVRDVLPRVRLIHSVDRLSLIEEIGRRADASPRVLLQVNIAGEDTKTGFAPADLDAALHAAAAAGVRVGGLMCLPPFAEDPEQSRRWFADVRVARDNLRAAWAPDHDLADLSMGTSQDFLVAVEAGATMVRVGRGIVDRTRMEQP
jgi:PLP dependent protein